MFHLHGEIVGGGRSLAVLAGGDADPHEQALAAKTLQTLTPLFKKSDPPGALVTGLTWPTVVQLATTYGDAWRPSETLQAWIREQVLARTTRRPLTYVPPAPMKPYPWQSEGADLIAATGRALITDEPGVGKTASAILGVVERWLRNPASFTAGPTIVVCPASVVDSWVREWKMWAPVVPVVAWRGTPTRRDALVGTAQVYVTSYDMARMDATEVKGHRALLDLDAAHLIADEVHFVRNGTTARTKAVQRLADRAWAKGEALSTVVALSGTPITRNTGDIHPALKMLCPPAWPSKERMVSRYCLSVQGDYEETILGLSPHTEPEFRMAMLGQHRRVKKDEVLTELPPKVYTTRTVEMPAKWRKAYDDFEASMFAEMPDGTELSVMDAMSMFTHLSSMASAPGTVRVEFGPDVDEETGELKRHVHIDLNPYDPKQHSWKVDAVLDILEERRGRQTVVFAPSRQLMEVAGAAAEKDGYRVGYIVGGQSAKARTADVDALQARELDVVFATTKAGGVGITLTAADAVVFMQRPWELDESIQAEDRCHRAGSEKLGHESIQIIDIIASGTIDERRRQALKGKVRQLAELVQDPRLAAELLGGKTVAEHYTTTPRELIA